MSYIHRLLLLTAVNYLRISGVPVGKPVAVFYPQFKGKWFKQTKSTVIPWKQNNDTTTHFRLNKNGKEITCPMNGNLRFDLTLTMTSKKNKRIRTLFCVDVLGNKSWQSCQPFRSAVKYEGPVTLSNIVNVIKGDKIKILIKGSSFIKRNSDLNRFMLHYV
ncbi:Hypothetical predicted protein [Mytilus galloprovincialis]|uniref:Uncharacterized protein n=1 Tax=Mytilus galloprovincialis TaxID=29158 RepID=A0A8B6CI45_MYTGA|nr:Hypothetical predicted protein [Mytilus galloprovincialis]